MNLRHTVREMRDLGLRRALFRISWEARMRSGFMRVAAPRAPRFDSAWADLDALPFAPPADVRGVLSSAEVDELVQLASDAAHGRLRCFGRWFADFGNPIDWHRDPLTGERWPADVHWSRVPLDRGSADVKTIWEAGRFSHAYVLARAAAHAPEKANEFGATLLAQIDSFVESTPFGAGVHWASGYEIALRAFAWTFALHVFRDVWDAAARERVLAAIYASAVHVSAFIDFARLSCDNDHLVGESLLLLIASRLFPRAPEGRRWGSESSGMLAAEAARQIDSDGAYFMASHVYHRAVLQMLALAIAFCGGGEAIHDALRHSRDFLFAQQNGSDGRLPNLGSNDGGVPFIASVGDFNDFRPVLQSISAMTSGERIYESGAWDEEMLWLSGARACNLPLRVQPRMSKSFVHGGMHALRGESSFAVFRCGSVRTRFPQIDMLHLDVWWRGRNVLADGGTYLYNGAPEWQAHFVRTASHNTISIDGEDQMLHYRQFKMLYWTEGKLRRFEPPVVSGEHHGYERIGCLHERTVIACSDDLWVVIDRVTGDGTHDLRLHWLGGESDFVHDASHRMTMNTANGPFSVAAYAADGSPLAADVVAGQTNPPRGWLSRYYGEKVAVPSFAVSRREALPFTFVSVLGSAVPEVRVDREHWNVAGFEFELHGGALA